MGVFSNNKPPFDGVIQENNGYWKAYFNGVCVAYHMQRYYCFEVLTLYRTGKLKV